MEQGGYNVPNDEVNTFVYEMIEHIMGLFELPNQRVGLRATSRRFSRRLDPASLR